MDHSKEFLDLVNDSKKRIRQCTIQEVMQKRARGETFYFVDVREKEEWDQGFATGAIHLGKGVIERDIISAIPNKNAEIILYCGGGYRSALAADAIQKMGYRNVLSMDGGMRAWRKENLPEQKP